MASITALVGSHGLIKRGDGAVGAPDMAVKAVQLALIQAGYRVDDDGVFGPGTDSAVRRFQQQQGLSPIDGEIGPATAARLDAPHEDLIITATPGTTIVGINGDTDQVVFPHDDTASLIAFYGKPWEDSSLLTSVPCPYVLRYREDAQHVLNFTGVQFHKKAAERLGAAFRAVWDKYGHDQSALDGQHLSWFSGTYNYRAVRGSSRLSCHAFGAAIDLDAEDFPLGSPKQMPADFVACFKDQGLFWGGNYLGRKDPMHFQAATEG